jgi:hypothetical protein
MELYSHERTPGFSYARIGYHYAMPGITDDHLAIMPDDVRLRKMPEEFIPAMRMGARNSVYFNAEQQLTNKKRTTTISGTLWEKNELLVWKPEKIKARKTFQFQVAKPGKKRVHCVFRLSPESGRIAFRLNNKPVILANKSEVLDLSRDFRTLSRNFTLAPIELKKGNNTLTLEYRGSDSSLTTPEIGFDFFWVQDTK